MFTCTAIFADTIEVPYLRITPRHYANIGEKVTLFRIENLQKPYPIFTGVIAPEWPRVRHKLAICPLERPVIPMGIEQSTQQSIYVTAR